MTGIERKLQQELEEQEYLANLRDIAALQAWKVFLANASDTTKRSILKLGEKAFAAADEFMAAREESLTPKHIDKPTEAEHVDF